MSASENGTGDGAVAAAGGRPPPTPDPAQRGWQTFGHAAAVRLLGRSLELGRLSHSYLFTGPRGVGKMSLALDLARAVNCRPAPDLFGDGLAGDYPTAPCGRCTQCDRISRGLHSDIRVIAVGGEIDGAGAGSERESGGRTRIRIGQIRQLQHEAALKPFEGVRRVFVIDGAEQMNLDAANCLLKTLEEPPDQVLLILLAEASDALLETIVSRCQHIGLRPVPFAVLESALIERYGASPDTAATLSRRARGAPGIAISMQSDPTSGDRHDQALLRILGVLTGNLEERLRYARELSAQFRRERDAVYAELDLWSDWWRDALLTQSGLDDATANPEWSQSLKGAASALGPSGVTVAAEAVDSARAALRANASPRLALEVFVLDLPSAPASIMPGNQAPAAARLEQ